MTFNRFPVTKNGQQSLLLTKGFNTRFLQECCEAKICECTEVGHHEGKTHFQCSNNLWQKTNKWYLYSTTVSCNITDQPDTLSPLPWPSGVADHHFLRSSLNTSMDQPPLVSHRCNRQLNKRNTTQSSSLCTFQSHKPMQTSHESLSSSGQHLCVAKAEMPLCPMCQYERTRSSASNTVACNFGVVVWQYFSLGPVQNSPGKGLDSRQRMAYCIYWLFSHCNHLSQKL